MGNLLHTQVFMWTGSTQEVQAWEYDASLVTKKYPYIHIKFETTTFPNYWTKLESEAASGDMPDIISLQSQQFPPAHPLHQAGQL